MIKKNEDHFLQSVKDVEPLKKNNLIKKKIKKIPSSFIKKIEVETTDTTINKPYSKRKPKSNFEMEFGKKNKDLKSGKIPFDKQIDFHGSSIADAEKLFNSVLVDSYYKEKRCLLFVTGKGLNKKNYLESSPNQQETKLFYGKIRGAFLEWVKKPELAKFILTFQQANLENGGDGAFFVYLRKKTNQSKL